MRKFNIHGIDINSQLANKCTFILAVYFYDPEVASLIINSVVDDISLYKSSIDRNRILDETVKALCRYLKIKPINN